MDYESFILAKARPAECHGFDVPAQHLPAVLFDFQRDMDGRLGRRLG